MPATLSIPATRRFGTHSPLRYPGGKAALAGLFADLIADFGWRDATYVEPYAGGAGAGVALLREGLVRELVVNDLDPAVHSFWHSIVHENDEFLRMLDATPLTVEEWRRQRKIYRAANANDPLELGFAFFYLNRTNRSGVLTGGVIGGLNQTGNYKMDARFNRETLRDRIDSLGNLADQITVRDDDGRTVILDYAAEPEAFLYIDPPYVRAGSQLYLNAFDARDHSNLASVVASAGGNWFMTYDESPLIEELYAQFFLCRYELNYSARHPGRAHELMIASPPVEAALARVTASQSA